MDPDVLGISVAIVATALACVFFLHWLVRDVLKSRPMREALGTLALIAFVFVFSLAFAVAVHHHYRM